MSVFFFFQEPYKADKANKESLGEMGQCYSFISTQRHLQTQSRGGRRGQRGGEDTCQRRKQGMTEREGRMRRILRKISCDKKR